MGYSDPILVVLVAFGSIVAVRIARGLALEKSLLDIPNGRSSHMVPVPRLGGAAFMPVVLLAVGLMGPRAGLPGGMVAALLGGATALFVISLADDFFTLSASVRFAVQFVAAGGFVGTVLSAWPADTVSGFGFWVSISDSGFGVPWSRGPVVSWSHGPLVLLTLLTLWLVGTINIFNFMDGIDGIAGLQAVVAGSAWCVFGTLFSAPFVAFLGACTAAGATGFLTLNWPPAKIFMGDAGSTVLGFLFAAAPLVFVIETKRAVALDRAVIAAALVLWPFLVDGTFTIFRRLWNRENILKAHRSHLYQRLVIAGKSHVQVTLVYGALAGSGGMLAWGVLRSTEYGLLLAAVVVALSFLALWRWTVVSEMRAKRRSV